MRVLLVSDLFPPVPGGLEFHVSALAQELARLGDDVCVATLTPDPVPAGPGVEVRTLPSVAHALPHHHPSRPFHPPLPDPIARRALRRIIETFRPDVIHGHSWLAVSLPRDTGVPVLFTAHDYGLVCQLRTLIRPDGSTCTGPEVAKCTECGTHTYGRVRSALMTRGTNAGRRLFPADRILAVSSAVRDALEPWVDTPIDVVPNFVGPEPAAEPVPDDVPAGRFVMYAGDGRDFKGVPDLLDVWREGVDVPLLLATPREARTGVPAGVVPVSLTRGQVTTAWRRADLAVVPSRWGDPCPTVVIEAMRAGLPVVGTTAGGIPEMVRDGVDGLLVPVRDPAALGGAIRTLLADADLRSRLGSNAMARAQDFTVGTVAGRIRAHYQDMVTAGRPVRTRQGGVHA